MVCLAAEGAVSIAGGNWQIFAGMAKASGAEVRLNTTVAALAQSADTGRWTVTDAAGDAATYDAVVVAGPWQFSGLSVTPPLAKTPDEVPYATLHVTLFTSPRRLAPSAFGMRAGAAMPSTILTTLAPDELADAGLRRGEGAAGVGSAGFFSISTLRETIKELPHGGGRLEYLYKIFSPEPFPDDRILELLGVDGTEAGGADGVVGWSYRHVWRAYPYEYPRVTFEEPVLADGLWYTGGMDSFISTMETNSLMGMNVARLVADRWEAEAKAAAAGTGPAAAEAAHGRVLTEL